MKKVLRVVVLVSILALAWGAGWLASGIGVGRVAPEATLEEREQAFEGSMREVVLDGSFTVAWPEPREGVYTRPLRDRGGDETGRRPVAV